MDELIAHVHAFIIACSFSSAAPGFVIGSKSVINAAVNDSNALFVALFIPERRTWQCRVDVESADNLF